jgi:uncharacterized protein
VIPFALLLLLLPAVLPGAAGPWARWDGKTLPPAPDRVNDYSGLLTPEEKQQLLETSLRLEEKHGIQLVYVVLDSLGGYPIEDYGLFLGRGWGVGQSDKNNGVLIITALEDRELRIEVGYGLEGSLTDVACGRIIDNLMVPRFKNGEYFKGLFDAGMAVEALVSGEALETSAGPDKAVLSERIRWILVRVVIVLLILSSLSWIFFLRGFNKKKTIPFMKGKAGFIISASLSFIVGLMLFFRTTGLAALFAMVGKSFLLTLLHPLILSVFLISATGGKTSGGRSSGGSGYRSSGSSFRGGGGSFGGGGASGRW